MRMEAAVIAPSPGTIESIAVATTAQVEAATCSLPSTGPDHRGHYHRLATVVVPAKAAAQQLSDDAVRPVGHDT